MPYLLLITPCGPLGLTSDGTALTHACWHPVPTNEPADDFLAEARRQVEAWFDGKLQDFDLPMAPEGTPFQYRVWRVMRTIDYGKTMTYGELAARVESSPRAVAQACGANPLPLFIPCHRVIGVQGLGGYGGSCQNPALKSLLLDVERRASGHNSEQDSI